MNQLEWIIFFEFEVYQDNFVFVLDVFQVLVMGEVFFFLIIGVCLFNFDGLYFVIGEKIFNFFG